MKRVISLLMAFVITLSTFAGISLTAKAAQVSGADIVAYAKQYVGYPYQYGKQGPDAFDCSGFVNYVFKHFGINLPVSSYDYWSNPTKYGKLIADNSTSGAQAGDVIIWSGHVAIYTGDGYCVEARNKQYGVDDSLTPDMHKNSNGPYKIIRIYGVADSGLTTTGDEPTSSWVKIDGKWYCYDNDGSYKKFWQFIDGKWYYFKSNGEMKTGWHKSTTGKWYYLNPSGAMAVYWKKVNGKWYYFKSSGEMKTGWHKSSAGKWYFLSTSSGGAMVAGTSWTIKDVLYQFDSSGALIE